MAAHGHLQVTFGNTVRRCCDWLLVSDAVYIYRNGRFMKIRWTRRIYNSYHPKHFA